MTTILFKSEDELRLDLVYSEYAKLVGHLEDNDRIAWKIIDMKGNEYVVRLSEIVYVKREDM